MANVVKDRARALESTDARALTKLATSVDDQTRMHVAVNPATPTDVVASLAQDACVDVRLAVLVRSDVDPSHLARAGGEDVAEVRWAVASHTATPAEVLSTLAEDAHEEVRRACASNVSTPADVVDGLRHDSFAGVRMTADMECARRIGAIVGREPGAVELALQTVDRPDLRWWQMSERVLTRAVESSIPDVSDDLWREVRRAVRADDAVALARMFTSKKMTERAAVAGTAGVPGELLSALCADPHFHVRVVADREVARRMEEWGVSPLNSPARQALMEFPWWTLRAGHPLIDEVLRTHRNP